MADVHAMKARGLINADELRVQFAPMEPELYRFALAVQSAGGQRMTHPGLSLARRST